MIEIKGNKNMMGKRLDVILSEELENKSRSFCQKLIMDENVLINDKIVTSKKEKVAENDIIQINIPEPKDMNIVAENIPLEIVYEDDDVIVINKPRGMVVHPAPGNYEGTMVNAIMYHCGNNLSSINGERRPGIVHRIDKDTTGLLVVAKNDYAHNKLSEQFAEHSVTRKYKAIVYNNIKNDSGRIETLLGRNPKNRMKQAVLQEGGRNAITNYKVLGRYSEFCLIEARLETGRTHQIRAHMAYIKHPLLGDAVYGPEKNKYGANGQMLHAYLLGFIHPRTGEYLEFQSELPDDFVKVLKKLKEKAK